MMRPSGEKLKFCIDVIGGHDANGAWQPGMVKSLHGCGQAVSRINHKLPQFSHKLLVPSKMGGGYHIICIYHYTLGPRAENSLWDDEQTDLIKLFVGTVRCHFEWFNGVYYRDHDQAT